MYQTVSQVWCNEVLPDEWAGTGVVCLLHKKGDLTVRKNYTGAMLLYIAYIVLSNILIVFPT
jgi:hypothetical protein